MSQILLINQQKAHYPVMSSITEFESNMKNLKLTLLSQIKNSNFQNTSIHFDDITQEYLNHFISANLNFGLYLLSTDEEDDCENLLTHIIQKIGKYYYKFKDNVHFTGFFDKCWRLCG